MKISAFDATITVVNGVILIPNQFSDAAIVNMYVHWTKGMAETAYAFANFFRHRYLRFGPGISPFVASI